MKILKLKNNQIELLFKILDGDLPFSRSRRRKLFTDILMAKYKAREEARLALIEKFGKKDDKGKPLTVEYVDEKGQKGTRFELQDQEAFNKEFMDLYMEEVIIDIPPSLEESIKVIKDIVENTDIVVKDNEVAQVEEIIKSFNEIKD
jgi:hypothetical protein